MSKMKGKTQDAPVLIGASMWQKGMRIEGTVSREFATKNGPCYEITLSKPAKIEGETIKKVAVGNLAGIKMALNAAGTDEFKIKDRIVLICTGSTDVGQMSPRVDFELEIDRP